eukprot:13734222-Heterocapsa_arctica.AAC.1
MLETSAAQLQVLRFGNLGPCCKTTSWGPLKGPCFLGSLGDARNAVSWSEGFKELLRHTESLGVRTPKPWTTA